MRVRTLNGGIPINNFSEGFENEDLKYAFLFLALEMVSLILDLRDYFLASLVLSVVVLLTTIYANFLRTLEGEPKDQQRRYEECASSGLQFVLSCCSFIAKTNYNSPFFPLVHAIISLFFALKRKNKASRSPSDPPTNGPSNESALNCRPTGEAETDPLNESLGSVHTSDDPEDPSADHPPLADPSADHPPSAEEDPSADHPPSASASLPQSSELRQRKKHTLFHANPLYGALRAARSASASLPKASTMRQRSEQPHFVSGPIDDSLSLATYTDSVFGPFDDEPKMSGLAPQPRELRQRKKHTQFQKLMFKVDLPNDKAKMEALKTVSSISGVDKNSIQVDTEEKKMTLIATKEAVAEHVVDELRKLCHTELISVGPAEQPKTTEEKQSEAEEHFTRHGKHID